MPGNAAGPPVVVALPGEIDPINHAVVKAVLFGALDSPGLVIADMTKTTFCDSLGVRILIMAHEHASASGSVLRVALQPGGRVARRLAIFGAGRVLHLYASVQDAMAASRARAGGEPAAPRPRPLRQALRCQPRFAR